MGVGRGTGGVRSGLASKVVAGAAAGVMVVAMGACSTSSKTGGVAGNVTIAQALADYSTGNVTLAKAEFTQITKTDPGEKYAWYNLGVIAQGAGDNGTAADDYQQALKIDPNLESALYNYGVLMYQQKKFDDAINYLGKATTANPKDANALWDLGLALAQKGDPADNARAKKVLNEALKLDPSLIKTLGPPKGAAGGSGATVTSTTAGPKGASTSAP